MDPIKTRLKRVFENVLSFQKKNQEDFFLGQEHKYYELWKKDWEDMILLKDRILFYYLSTAKLLKNEDVRIWFELWLEALYNILEQNIKNLEDEKNKPVEEKPKKFKI